MKAYIHSRRFKPDGTSDTFHTFTVDVKENPLWWQERGLSYTASGYGKRIPTRYMAQLNEKWRRVYCCIYSNSGTCYVGEWILGRGAELTIGDIV